MAIFLCLAIVWINNWAYEVVCVYMDGCDGRCKVVLGCEHNFTLGKVVFCLDIFSGTRVGILGVSSGIPVWWML